MQPAGAHLPVAEVFTDRQRVESTTHGEREGKVSAGRRHGYRQSRKWSAIRRFTSVFG